MFEKLFKKKEIKKKEGCSEQIKKMNLILEGLKISAQDYLRYKDIYNKYKIDTPIEFNNPNEYDQYCKDKETEEEKQKEFIKYTKIFESSINELLLSIPLNNVSFKVGNYRIAKIQNFIIGTYYSSTEYYLIISRNLSFNKINAIAKYIRTYIMYPNEIIEINDNRLKEFLEI